MKYSSKTAPSTTKSMGSGKYFTAAGQSAQSSGGKPGGMLKQINGKGMSGVATYPDYFSGKFINAAGGRK